MEKLRKIGFSKLTSLEEALTKLFGRIKPNPIKEVEVVEALNRVLGEDIESQMNIPPFNRSAMDGYAVKAEDTFGASPNNPKKINLIGVIEIGETSDLILDNGEGIRISTGAPIPKGANAVIKIEDTEIINEEISLYVALVPRKNISYAGEDIKRGTQILYKGTVLKAEHIALLSSLGFRTIKVTKRPTVCVFASGDELIEPGSPVLIGELNQTLIFCLPGTPVAAYICFLQKFPQ